MNKIPTLFERDESRRFVTMTVTPGCEWVLAGEGRATRKWDGTCVMLNRDGWWFRREVKAGKPLPSDFVPVETDEATGKTFGWEGTSSAGFGPLLAEAMGDRYIEAMPEGTYELIGPKVNGNPENRLSHEVVLHGDFEIGDSPRDFEGLCDYLADGFPFEGIVWWHPDGRKAKLKRRDIRPEDS